MHIGNEIETDYNGAMSANCQALLLSRTGKSMDPSILTIKHLSDVLPLIHPVSPVQQPTESQSQSATATPTAA